MDSSEAAPARGPRDFDSLRSVIIERKETMPKRLAQVAAYARQIMPDWGGVGIYSKQGFTHIDVREAKADWTG